MSADTSPISPARFAEALKDLPLSALHLKVLELRNSIAHLDYSNEQLRPFALGTAGAEPDADCADAIAENEGVVARMQERIRLVRAEAEARGVSWAEFQSKEEVEAATNGHAEADGEEGEGRHAAWSDGTFQTGIIRNGEVSLAGRTQGQQDPGRGRGRGSGGGGTLTDEELRRRLEEQMGSLEDGEEEEGGMHL